MDTGVSHVSVESQLSYELQSTCSSDLDEGGQKKGVLIALLPLWMGNILPCY